MRGVFEATIDFLLKGTAQSSSGKAKYYFVLLNVRRRPLKSMMPM